MGETDVSHAFTVIATIFSSEDELLQHGISTGKKTLVQYIYTHRLILSYWLQNYDEAIQMAELYGKNHMRFLDICHVFYQGLTALRLAQRKDADEEKWTRMGETAVSSFKKWKDFSSWNFENKYTLLLAELHYVKGDHKAAEEQYKASIASAQSHRFLHEEGLAMESLGLLYRRSGNEKGAKEMFMNARTCYEKWGATAVVTRLDSLLESL
jgi:tetratricopeptide (TPR) repeat protein